MDRGRHVGDVDGGLVNRATFAGIDVGVCSSFWSPLRCISPRDTAHAASIASPMEPTSRN